MRPKANQRLARLTPREREILVHVCEGERSAEIAAALGITEATVKSHLNRTYKKLSVTSRVQAATYYLEHAGGNDATG